MAGDLALSIKIGAVTGGLLSALGGVKSSITQLGAVTSTLRTKQQALGDSIQKHMGTLAPRTLAALNRDYERLGNTIDKLGVKQRRLTALQARGVSLKEGRAGMQGQVMEVAAIGATAVLPVKLAIDFESAMADVKKVVDFETPEGFAKLGDEILRMSTTLPLAATELAAIAASGGQLGVKAGDIPKFTETIAKMATAFDMSAEAAGDAMAKLANVYKIPIANIGRLGDAINQLSNESPAKASDIVSALSRIGGVAKSFGLTELQAASLSNAFISLGKTPEVAGTAINGMLMKLGTADKQGDAFQDALAQMGVSAEGLKKSIENDAEGALVGFLKTLEKMPKNQRMGILVDLFGLEYADDVAVLAGSVNTYTDSIDALNKKGKDGKAAFNGSMEKEFAARAATTGNNLRLLKNALVALGTNIGAVVLPSLNELTDSLRPIVLSLASWVKANPGVVAGMVKLVAGIAAFRLSALAGRYAFSLLGSGINDVMKVTSLLHGKGLLLRALWQGGFSLPTFLRLLSLPPSLAGGMARVALGAKGLGASLKVGASVGAHALRGLSSMSLIWSRAFISRAAAFGALSLGKLVSGIRTVGHVLMFVGRAMLMNPIGLAITGLAVAGFLIYRNWDKIGPYFRRAWAGIKAFFSGGLAAVSARIVNWSPLGLFYKAFAGVLSWFGVKLPANFTDFGSMLVRGLISGITSQIGAAKAGILKLGGDIKGWFASTLGIKSPSRVFMGFGDNIAQGAALGIDKGRGRAGAAAAGLALATTMAWAKPVLPAPSAQPLPALTQRVVQQLRRPDALPQDALAARVIKARDAGGESAESVGKSGRAKAAGGAQQAMTITYSPQITVAATAPQGVRDQVSEALRLSQTEFERMLKRSEADRRRRSYETD